MPVVHVNNIDLYYEEYGQGEKVIISAQQNFRKREYPEILADHGYHVYLITLRGYGKSTHVFEDLGENWYPVWAEDVYQFARNFGIEKFIYTGISHGSGVGWQLADIHPEILKAFVGIVCGPHSRKTGEVSPARQETINAADDPAARERIISKMKMLHSDNPAVQKRYRKAFELQIEFIRNAAPEELRLNPRKPFAWLKTDEELEEKLKTIKVPTLMIGGMKDHIIAPEDMMRSVGAVPGAKTIMYQDCGHNVAVERLENVEKDVLRFLEELG